MSDAPCTLRLNGAPLPCPADLTLAALLAQQGIAPTTVATALNGDFVARARRDATVLSPGDAITTFQPIVGG